MSTYWYLEPFQSALERQLLLQKNSILNIWEGFQHVWRFKYVRVLNFSKFLQIWQRSEYASICVGCSNGKDLNIPGLQVCQVSMYESVAQGSEYAWI